MLKTFDLSLYLVTDQNLAQHRALEWIIEQAVLGGVTMVQLREKQANTRRFLQQAERLKAVLDEFEVPLIINDRLDIALAIDADGLHVGQEDLPYPLARKILGPQKIIGLSIESFQQAQEAQHFDVDYIGISMFQTPTKKDMKPPLGIEGVSSIVRFSKHRAVAIGGIKPHNTQLAMGTQVEGIAVVSAIISADDPKEAAKALKHEIDAYKQSVKV